MNSYPGAVVIELSEIDAFTVLTLNLDGKVVSRQFIIMRSKPDPKGGVVLRPYVVATCMNGDMKSAQGAGWASTLDGAEEIVDECISLYVKKVESVKGLNSL